MAALPPLHNLRLADTAPTGIPITLIPKEEKNRVAAVPSGSGKKSKSTVDTDPTNDVVADFTDPDAAFDRWSDLMCDILQPYSLFVHEWRQAICTNMLEKRQAYNYDDIKVAVDVVTEHEKQLEIYERALLRLREGDAKSSLYAPKDNEENPWDVVDRTRWTELQSQKGEIDKIQKDIAARIAVVNDDEKWATAVARFANDLIMLSSYRNQSDMLEKIVDTIRAFVKNPKLGNSQFNNVMIMGEPGTGKTRLAEIIGNIYAQLGLYVYEGIVEATAGDFIAEYQGQTGAKSRSFMVSNLERVIFLDEAYALTKWEDNNERLESYSDEAVNTIIPFLSKNVGKLGFIVAGYEKDMKERFLRANAGMKRRFPITALLPGYEPQVLYDIFIRETALTFAGFKPPASQEKMKAQWSENLSIWQRRLSALFTTDATDLFIDVLIAADARVGEGDDDADAKEPELKPDELDKVTAAKTVPKEKYDILRKQLDACEKKLAEKDSKRPYSITEDIFDREVQRRAIEMLGRDWKEQKEEEEEEEEEKEDPIEKMADDLSHPVMSAMGHKKSKNRQETNYKYPKLGELFRFQAGAMSNLAGTASALILANGAKIEESEANRVAMFNILMTFIQTEFTGVNEENVAEAELARRELVKVLAKQKWMDPVDPADLNGAYRWTSYMGFTKAKEDAEAKEAAEAKAKGKKGATSTDAVPKPGEGGKAVMELCETLTLETHIRPDQIKVYNDGSGRKFECQVPDLFSAPAKLFKPPKKGPSADEAAKKKAAAAKKKAEEVSLEVKAKTLRETLGSNLFRQLFKYTSADGKEMRGAKVDGRVKVKVPTLIDDPRKAPSDWSFDRDTENGNFSDADLETVEKWLNNKNIADTKRRREVIESAKDLKYQWWARKEVEAGIYKLLEEKLKDTQDEIATRLSAEKLAAAAGSDAGSSTGPSEADSQSVQGSASEPPSTPRSQGAAADAGEPAAMEVVESAVAPSAEPPAAAPGRASSRIRAKRTIEN